MSHQESYRHNEAYAAFLAGWDAGFYAKYADTLRPASAGARVLDVGCGVGQVVARLTEAGYEAHGVDVSEPNIQRARAFSDRCQLYNGKKLPFPDRFFASVGALNVLEHVDEPEAFIQEMVRVTQIGGRIVLSSPNGWPIATTHSPTLSLFGSPMLTLVRPLASILISAVSVRLSEPITLALNSRLSESSTRTSSASSTT